MKKLALLSTVAVASLACGQMAALAQEVQDTPPAPPGLITLDTISECAGDGPIICEAGLDPTGVGSADPGAEIIIRGDAVVMAAAGPSVFFPTFEVGAITEADMGTITLEAGGQVQALTDFSFGVTTLGSDSLVSISGDVISTGDFGGGLLSAFGLNNTFIVEETGTVFSSGETSHAISLTGDGHSVIVNGLVQTQGFAAAGVLVGFGVDQTVTVSETGQVFVEGMGSPGLSTFFETTTSNTVFNNAGLVQAFGTGGQGITLATPGTSANNSGTIATMGQGSQGILLVQSNHTVTNSGFISTSGSDLDTTYEEFLGLVLPGNGTTPITVSASGIFIGNGGISVTNSGTIIAADAAGISTNSDFAAITNVFPLGAGDASLPVTIINTATGTISGTVGIHGSALIEQATNAGTINGDVLLAEGDDSLTLDLDTSVINGFADGGSGLDSLTLIGTGAAGVGLLDGANQGGFEALTVDGIVRLTGAFGDVETFAINSGVASFEMATVGAMNGATLADGAALTGSGTISGDLLASGMISPGSVSAAPGVLNISGDLTQADTGTLLISVSEAGSDQVLVGGSADLMGALTIDLAAGTNFGVLPDQVSIVETGGGVAATGLAAFTADSGVLSLTATPVIAGNDILLDFNVVSDFAGLGGLDANEAAIASALDAGFAASIPGGSFSEAIGVLSDAASPDTIDLLSAEFYDPMTRASVLIASQSLDQVRDRVQDAPFGAGTGFWVAANYEAFDRTDQDVFGYEIDLINLALGVDVDLGPVLVGFAGTYANADVDVLTSPGEEDGDVDVFGLLGYVATANPTGFNFGATVGYQFVDAETQRSAPIAGINSSFAADYDPDAFLADTRASFTHGLNESIFLRGGLGLDLIIVQDISFNEAGGGEFGLAVTSATYEEFSGTASLDLIGRFGEDGQQVRPSLGVHVRQVFTDDAPQFVGTFLNSPAGSFAVNGSLDETEYGVNAGLAVALFDNRATLSAGYRGTFSSNNSAHQGNVRLVVPF